VKLALVFNPQKPSTLRILARIVALARAGRHEVLLWGPAGDAVRRRTDYSGESEGVRAVDDLREADAVVALGGDGTLLHTVRLLQGAERPLLGINLGSLGFLTDTPEDHAEEAVRRLLEGRYRIDSRMLLEASHLRLHGEPQVLVGLNDAVVHGPGARVLDLSLRIGGVELGRTLADGVIIATPSGSTAYSLSAGGPVVSPRLQALVVTPISPHTLAMRPIVVAADEEIEIFLHRSAGGNAGLSVDGQTTLELAEGERITVRRAPRDLPLVVTADRTFYDTLRTKLGWGHRGRSA
jgi:NAD+ kinase